MTDSGMLQSTALTSPYLEGAAAIARELVGSAKRMTVGFGWDGDELIGADEKTVSIVHGPSGADLYSGTAGIAWFLAQYGRFADSKGCIDTALGAMQAGLTTGAKFVESGSLSLFSGATGVALAAVEIAEWLDASCLRAQGLALAEQIADLVIADPEVLESDLLGGLAGIVIGLLALQRHDHAGVLRNASRVACEELIGRARREAWGWSWPDRKKDESTPALCGLAHGASGIGLALTEGGVQLAQSEFLAAAREAFRYEQSWFSSERCAWADLREGSQENEIKGEWPSWTNAWCHGALGIGLARLRWYAFSRDDWALAQASAAIQAARPLVVQSWLGLRQKQYGDVSLCHGLSGIIELFLTMADTTGIDEHRRAAERVGDLCLEINRANRGNWTNGLRGAQTVPGLFLGLAGVGLSLLRLHNPAVFRSPASLAISPDCWAQQRTKKSAATHPLQHSGRR